MAQAILSTNIKGGTGKSTVAQLLAYEMRDRGFKVGVMDADIDSSNLATRFGTDKKVTFTGDHIIEPVEHDGIKLFSMENAFEDSSFSQSGKFMSEVVKNMVESSAWGDDLDYLIVDCPPGSSDIFEEIVRALRVNLLGAVSVGMSNEYEDTARLVKVCNHTWVPIIGFIENMSGVVCHGEPVQCSVEDHEVAPFGRGKIKEFAENVNGNYLGSIPLVAGDTELEHVAEDAITSAADAIENTDNPELPEDNLGDSGFIRNVWGSISAGFKQINENIPIDKLQNKYGVEGREPLVMKLELTDAGAVTGIFSEAVITADGGDMKVMRPKKAKRRGVNVEGGIRISSQDLKYALDGEKKVLRSTTGEVVSEPYSIIDAVKMGDAEAWGDKTINRLAVLDKILTDVVPMDEVTEMMG